MKAFDVGWVPKGWTRGQELKLFQARPNWRGSLSQAFDVDSMPPIGAIQGDDVAHVSFAREDGKAVDRWLDWWHERGEFAATHSEAAKLKG